MTIIIRILLRTNHPDKHIIIKKYLNLRYNGKTRHLRYHRIDELGVPIDKNKINL